MISKELREWKYYYDKFPLYFKNDENIIGHFRMLYDLLIDLDDISEEVFKLLDIFNINDSELNENILDMLGAIYGVYRNITFDFELTISGSSITKTPDTDSNIELNNEEFLVLIMAQIIKNNYNGTYEELNKYYNYIKQSTGIMICIKDVNATPGNAKVYLIEEPDNSHINYYYLLYSGLLTVESAGVNYDYEVSNIMTYLYWDDVEKGYWDEARWY